jgi:chromosome segregation ATPase
MTIEDKLTVSLVFLIYSAACWLCCRLLYRDSRKTENNRKKEEHAVPKSVSAEQGRAESFMKENDVLKAENERLKTKLEQLAKICGKMQKRNNQLTEDVKTMKIYIDVLFEALQAVRASNKRLELELHENNLPSVIGTPDRDTVYDSGTTPDKFEAMIQVMKGSPVSNDTHRQAFQAIQKTEGTEIYNQLVGRISGASERLEAALNMVKQPEVNIDADGKNTDIMKYIRV